MSKHYFGLHHTPDLRSTARPATDSPPLPVLSCAVTAALKAGGAPELLSALLEGESLFNDASGLVLFDIFLRKNNEQSRRQGENAAAAAAAAATAAASAAAQGPAGGLLTSGVQGVGFTALSAVVASGAGTEGGFDGLPSRHKLFSLLEELMDVSGEFLWLAGGGLAMGILFGYLTT